MKLFKNKELSKLKRDLEEADKSFKTVMEIPPIKRLVLDPQNMFFYMLIQRYLAEEKYCQRKREIKLNAFIIITTIIIVVVSIIHIIEFSNIINLLKIISTQTCSFPFS
jgi:hypothetical protein